MNWDRDKMLKHLPRQVTEDDEILFLRLCVYPADPDLTEKWEIIIKTLKKSIEDLKK